MLDVKCSLVINIEHGFILRGVNSPNNRGRQGAMVDVESRASGGTYIISIGNILYGTQTQPIVGRPSATPPYLYKLHCCRN